MKSLKLLLFVVAAAGFTACSSDDKEMMPGGQEPETPLPPLAIEVKENPMVNPDATTRSADELLQGKNAPTTRAAITTTTTLSEFNIYYVYGSVPYTGSVTATKSGEGKWTSNGSWPQTSEAINWYASSNGTFQDASNPYISFTVEENATAQKDLLVAKTTAKYSDANGKVSFTFDHACTALRFLVKKATNLIDYTLSITEVKLCNVIKEGEYYYGTTSWTPGSSCSSYTLYNGSAKTLGATEYEALDSSDEPYLFMIPQTLTAWDGKTAITSATNQTYIQITCTITKDATSVYSGTAYIPFAANLVAGYQHDVKINIGKNSLYSGANTKVIKQ